MVRKLIREDANCWNAIRKIELRPALLIKSLFSLTKFIKKENKQNSSIMTLKQFFYKHPRKQTLTIFKLLYKITRACQQKSTLLVYIYKFNYFYGYNGNTFYGICFLKILFLIY